VILVSVVVMVLRTSCLLAGDATSPLATTCPGAAAWRQAHREQLPAAMEQRDEARRFTMPELRLQLKQRTEKDQQARKALLASPQDVDLSRRVQNLDADTIRWLEQLAKETGVPTVEQVGEMGVHWTWLLVQHMDDDPGLQAALLPQFENRHAAGELPAEDLAKLTDRVLLAQGKPQRYGTQFDWYSGVFKPRNVGDLGAIEANRNALGLMPLADYGCMMNARLKQE
jgi:hypothetical protein